MLKKITEPITAFFNLIILQICRCHLPNFSTRAVIWEFWELGSVKLKYFLVGKVVWDIKTVCRIQKIPRLFPIPPPSLASSSDLCNKQKQPEGERILKISTLPIFKCLSSLGFSSYGLGCPGRPKQLLQGRTGTLVKGHSCFVSKSKNKT